LTNENENAKGWTRILSWIGMLGHSGIGRKVDWEEDLEVESTGCLNNVYGFEAAGHGHTRAALIHGSLARSAYLSI
jgi:hypothetical protein